MASSPVTGSRNRLYFGQLHFLFGEMSGSVSELEPFNVGLLLPEETTLLELGTDFRSLKLATSVKLSLKFSLVSLGSMLAIFTQFGSLFGKYLKRGKP